MVAQRFDERGSRYRARPVGRGGLVGRRDRADGSGQTGSCLLPLSGRALPMGHQTWRDGVWSKLFGIGVARCARCAIRSMVCSRKSPGKYLPERFWRARGRSGRGRVLRLVSLSGKRDAVSSAAVFGVRLFAFRRTEHRSAGDATRAFIAPPLPDRRISFAMKDRQHDDRFGFPPVVNAVWKALQRHAPNV